MLLDLSAIREQVQHDSFWAMSDFQTNALYIHLLFFRLSFSSSLFVFFFVSFPCSLKKDGPGTDFSLTTLQRVRREMAHTFLSYLM